jgi:hypothetical protein
MNLNLLLKFISSLLLFQGLFFENPIEDYENFKFKLNDGIELVSVITPAHSNPARVPLEIAIRLKSKGEVINELIFDYSISSMWRISQTEFFVLLGSENLIKIKVENQKILKVEENKIYPFGEPTFGTSINKNLFFKLGSLVVYYDSYDRSSYRIYFKSPTQTKEIVVGMNYPGLIDRQQFIYPPHRTIMIKNRDLYILDEVRSVVHIIDSKLTNFRKVKLEEGYEYQWDLFSSNLSLLRRDKKQNITKIAFPLSK